MSEPTESREMERRSFAVRELRASAEGEAPKITGYAALFDQPSEDMGGFVEKIRPGAFSETLKVRDQRALWNHNDDMILGRRKAGTLELAEDEIGLRFTIYPPDTQVGRDAVASMRRGDVDQMSFGFYTLKDEWIKDENNQTLRTLIEVELWEVSPVVFPAYPQTSAFVRSKIKEITAPAADIGGEGQAPDPDAERKTAQARRIANRKRVINTQDLR